MPKLVYSMWKSQLLASVRHTCFCVSVLPIRFPLYEMCKFVCHGKCEHTWGMLVSVLELVCVCVGIGGGGEGGTGGGCSNK